ncbi:CheR family methyltransferase, partial [Mycobacterium sp.]|uniref:CheR family methyltransferase n=1 Tax=Mycobacterium sp. TaxID=1785 RepID=UPI003F80BD88
MDTTTDEAFEGLLRYMRDSRGFDFTGYKRTSLMRRVRHRMDQAGYTAFDEYLDFLQASSDEFTALFNTILINVTSFFRDPEAWEFVSTEVIPRLLAERGPDDPIRVWSAGCASGQEAYTLAMLLAEALGAEAFRQRVKIYATDVDEDALSEARSASYDAKAVESVPPDLLARYFEQVNGGRYVFHKDLRRAVIFGRNDLVKDAPISRVDLLVCRNTLMYLNAET